MVVLILHKMDKESMFLHLKSRTLDSAVQDALVAADCILDAHADHIVNWNP